MLPESSLPESSLPEFSSPLKAGIRRPPLLARALPWFIATLCGFACLAASSHVAHAEKAIAVLDFSGPKSSRFEKAIRPIVKRISKVLPQSRYKKATRKIRRFKPNRKNLRKLSERLGLDGYVRGKVTRRKGRFRLKIDILGSDGRTVGDSITLVTKRPNLNKRQKRKLRRELEDAFERLEGSSSRDDDDDDEDEDFEGDDEDEDFEGDDEDEDFEGDDEDEDESKSDDGDKDDSSEKSDVRSSSSDDNTALPMRKRGVAVHGGLSFNQRNLSFSADAGGVAPQGYRGSLVPGVYVDLSVFPMVLTGTKGVLANIGLAVNFDRVLALESTLEGMEETVLPTSQQRFGVGALYRHNLSPDKDRGISIRGAITYNALSFVIDKSMAPAVTIPSVGYRFLQIGGDIDIPAGEKVNVTLGAAYYLMLASGEMQEADSYGGAAVGGFDGHAGASYAITKQIVASLNARYVAIGHTFDGTGDLTDRDNNDDQDVADATDTFLSFFTTVGYFY